MKIKKAIALTAAFSALLSLASCVTIKVDVPAINVPAISNLYDPDSSDNSGNNQTPATPDETQAPAQDETQAPAQDETQAPATPDTPSQAPEAPTQSGKTEAPTQAPSTPASSKPTSKEEIITYYVTAYNKIATEGKKVTRTYDNTTNYKNIVKIGDNAQIKSLCEKLMKQFMKPNNEAVASSAKDLPPVGVTKLSISPSQISSAACNDKGSYYEVVLKSTGTDSNYEIDSVAGKGSAGVIGPLLRTEDVSSAAGSFIKFDGLHAKYATCTVTAKIDKSSGHITEFNFNSPCILHFDKVTALGFIKVENCDLGLLFEQKWTVAY